MPQPSVVTREHVGTRDRHQLGMSLLPAHGTRCWNCLWVPFDNYSDYPYYAKIIMRWGNTKVGNSNWFRELAGSAYRQIGRACRSAPPCVRWARASRLERPERRENLHLPRLRKVCTLALGRHCPLRSAPWHYPFPRLRNSIQRNRQVRMRSAHCCCRISFRCLSRVNHLQMGHRVRNRGFIPWSAAR